MCSIYVQLLKLVFDPGGVAAVGRGVERKRHPRFGLNSLMS